MQNDFALNAEWFCIECGTVLCVLQNTLFLEYGTVFASNIERYCFDFEQHMCTHTHASYPHLLTPPPPPPPHTPPQTNKHKENHTSQIHHARTFTPTQAHTPPNATSPHSMPPHPTPRHLTPPHATSPHPMPPHPTTRSTYVIMRV